MPRVQSKAKVARKRYQYTEAICVEGFRSGFLEDVPRGRVWPKDHRLVKAHPEFWRLLGPRPDEEVNDA